MESFSISCTTCQARLKVRDRSAIGQILSCPKCGSMVMVQSPADDGPHDTPPTQQTPPDPQWADTVVDNFDLAADMLADEPPIEPTQPAGTNKSAGKKKSPVAAVQPTSPSDTPAGDDATTTSKAAEEQPQPGEPAGEEVAAPTAMSAGGWMSPLARRWQSWLLLSGAALFGIVLAVVLVGMMFRKSSSDDDADPKLAENQQTPAEDQDPPPVNPDMPTDPASDDPPDPVKDPPTTPDKPPVLPKPPTTPDKPPTTPDKPPADTEDPLPKPPVRDDEPPDLAKPKDDEPDKKPGLEEFDKFSPFLDDLPFELLPEGKSVPIARKDLPLLPKDVMPKGIARPRPTPRDVDVVARQADKVAKIEFAKIPLIDFLHFMSEMSTLPISLDADALSRAGIAPEAPVDVSLADTTVQQLLEKTLSKRDLVYRQSDGYLLVTTAAAGSSEQREASYSVSDLAGGDAEKVKLIGQAVMFLVAPASWEAAGGEGSMEPEEGVLLINQSDAVHYQVQLLFDKLRVAQGSEPQGDLPAELLKTTTRSRRGRDSLAKPISMTFVRPTPLVKIFRRIRQQAGVQILVDWRAVGEAGWSYDADAALSADDKPLGEALGEILGPMGLIVRVVDETTLQVTTPEAEAKRLELELYDVSKLLTKTIDGATLVAQLKADLGLPLFLDQGGAGAMVFDPQSKHLLVSLPQAWQAELEKRLAKRLAGK